MNPLKKISRRSWRNLIVMAVTCTALIPGLSGHAQKPPKDPEQVLIDIQRDLIELDRQFELIRKDLFFPKDSEVLFYLRNTLEESFPVQSVDLVINGKSAFQHKYSDTEKIAFSFSDLQPLYRTELKPGSHQVLARFTWATGKDGKLVTREHRFALSKEDLPRFVEIEVAMSRKEKALVFAEKIW